MLKKLIKYELRSSGRLIPLVYLAVVMLTLLALILASAKAYIYFFISFGLLFVAGTAAIIITYVVIFVRFYKGMFGSEGYLVMTLPTTSANLYLSKSIVAFLWLLLGCAVTIACWVGAGYMLVEVALAVPEYVYIQQELIDIFTLLFSTRYVVLLVFSTIVGYLSFVAQVFFSVTVSNVRPFYGMGIGGAVLAYIALEFVAQVCSFLFMLVIPYSLVFNAEIGWYFANVSMMEVLRDLLSVTAHSPDVGVSMGFFIVPLLFAFGLPFLTIRLLDTRVTLK